MATREDFERFPSNSKTKKPETERVVTPLVKSEDVVIGKKGIFSRMPKMFFTHDIHSIAAYVLESVIAPKVQDIFLDTVTRGAEYMVYGDTRASKINKGHKSSIQYGGVINQSKTRTTEEQYPSNRMSSIDRKKSYNDYSDLIFKDQQIAEEVLSRMYDDLREYGCCTVLSLKGMLGHETVYTDEKYGWMELTGSRVRRVRDGWLLELPPAIFLD